MTLLELRSCPFCHGNRITGRIVSVRYFFTCDVCGCNGPAGTDLEDAAVQWNNREKTDKARADICEKSSVHLGELES